MSVWSRRNMNVVSQYDHWRDVCHHFTSGMLTSRGPVILLRSTRIYFTKISISTGVSGGFDISHSQFLFLMDLSMTGLQCYYYFFLIMCQFSLTGHLKPYHLPHWGGNLYSGQRLAVMQPLIKKKKSKKTVSHAHALALLWSRDRNSCL